MSSVDSEFRGFAGTVSRQSAVFFSGMLFTVGLGYPFKILVARVVGAEGLGLYGLGMSIIDILSLFATFGLSGAAAKYVAVYAGKKQDQRLRFFIRQGVRILLIASLFLAILMVLTRGWIADTLFSEPQLKGVLPWFALLLPMTVTIGFLGQTLRGFQEVTRQTVITTYLRFGLKILLTLALFSLGWGLRGYIVGEIGAVFVTTAALTWAVFRLIRDADSSPKGSRGFERDVVFFAASMFGLGLLGFFSGKIDQLLVGIYMDAEELGIYLAALTTAGFVPILLVSLNSIFGPVIANLHARGEVDLLQRLFQTSTKWAIGLTTPAVAVILLFAPELMRIFGTDFEAGAKILVVVALAQLVNVGVGSVGSILLMSGHQRFEVLTVAVTALLTLSLHFVLIPRLGAFGAAISVASGICLSNLMRLGFVRRRLGLSPYNRGYVRLVPPLVISVAVTVALKQWSQAHAWPYWASLAAALIASYGAFAVFAPLLALDRDDRIIARAAWARLRTSSPPPA